MSTDDPRCPPDYHACYGTDNDGGCCPSDSECGVEHTCEAPSAYRDALLPKLTPVFVVFIVLIIAACICGFRYRRRMESMQTPPFVDEESVPMAVVVGSRPSAAQLQRPVPAIPVGNIVLAPPQRTIRVTVPAHVRAGDVFLVELEDHLCAFASPQWSTDALAPWAWGGGEHMQFVRAVRRRTRLATIWSWWCDLSAFSRRCLSGLCKIIGCCVFAFVFFVVNPPWCAPLKHKDSKRTVTCTRAHGLAARRVRCDVAAHEDAEEDAQREGGNQVDVKAHGLYYVYREALLARRRLLHTTGQRHFPSSAREAGAYHQHDHHICGAQHR